MKCQNLFLEEEMGWMVKNAICRLLKFNRFKDLMAINNYSSG